MEDEIRRVIPKDQLQLIVDNIGLPPGGINLAYSSDDATSNRDGAILISFTEKRRPTQQWMRSTVRLSPHGSQFSILV